MLELENISKSIDENEILEDITYSFPSTGMYLLRGDNGSGKSTLLDIMAGKAFCTGGNLRYGTTAITPENRDMFAEEKISYLAQDPMVFADETVYRNLILPFSHIDKKKALLILQKLGLDKLKDSKAENLSGGEKERLAFGRILYEPKEIILLDEITSELDRESREILLSAMESLSQDHLVLFVTHEDTGKHFVQSGTFLRLENHHLREEKKGKISEEEKSSPDHTVLKKPTLLERLGRAFKLERFPSLLYAGISFLLSALCVFFFSYQKSFVPNDSNQILMRESNLRKEIYKENTPVFYAEEENVFTGERIPCLDGNLMLNKKAENVWKDEGRLGNYFSGFFKMPKENSTDFPLTIASGRAPEKNGEAVLSDLYQGQWKEGEKVESAEGLSYTVVGFYRSAKQGQVSLRYQKAREATEEHRPWDFMVRATYAFMQETVFVKDSRDLTYAGFYPANEANKAIFMKRTAGLNSALYAPVSVDRNGEEKLSSLFARGFKGSTFLLLLSLFLLVYLLSFIIRNKRKYLLLRFLGMSRERETKDNILLLSLLSLTSMALGFLSGTVGFLVFNGIYRKIIIDNAVNLLSYSYLSLLFVFLAHLVFLLAYSLVLTLYLSPKHPSYLFAEEDKA